MGLLDGLLGGSTQRTSSGMSPLTMLLMGVLAYRTYQGKGRLADMLRQGAPAGPKPGNVAAPSAGGLGGLLTGGLGGLLGGATAGGLLSGGLSDLVNRFQQNGHGEIANSWIGTGPNRSVSPDQLEQALGPDTVNSLSEQAGISQIDLLSGLSRDLPSAVDELTPDGRIPNG
ncbi:MAG: hypothetical protein QOG38_1895 [Hyphomicrobiales bacterium]|jgi:uncharacterized protein YidB (DUF937 family)|nr:hypothetical protein [Hyphomicrobiales bacterium]